MKDHGYMNYIDLKGISVLELVYLQAILHKEHLIRLLKGHPSYVK